MPERRRTKNLRSTKHAAKKLLKKPAKKAPKAVKRSKPAKKVEASKPGQLKVYDLKGKVLETVTADALFQGDNVNQNVVYQAALMYQAGEREGTASTLDRGHVRGGGKKPWKQKGTGQARHGSNRSPIWRGGGTTFGPSYRDYSYTLPAQLKRLAVSEVMKDKVMTSKLVLIDRLELETPKTKFFSKFLNSLKLERPLVVVDKRNDNLVLAARNIQGISIKTSNEVNALDVARHRTCLMSKAAYTGLIKRLKA